MAIKGLSRYGNMILGHWWEWYIVAALVVLLVFMFLTALFGCENPNQKRERIYFSMCPPGQACLSPQFAINRLKRDLYVKYDQKQHRFVQVSEFDPQAIVLHEGNIVDFWRVPQYVVVTPGPDHRVHILPNESLDSASRSAGTGMGVQERPFLH